jgi:hypothetical protein
MPRLTQIQELCRQISEERDAKKVIELIKKMRVKLIREQTKLEQEINKPKRVRD